jgi:hypothetical protein
MEWLEGDGIRQHTMTHRSAPPERAASVRDTQLATDGNACPAMPGAWSSYRGSIMADTRLSAALERDQRDEVLQREWRFERTGWAALGIVLAAGLVGVFGDGAVAAASDRSADGAVLLRYERIIRQDAPSALELRLAAAPVADSVVIVSLTEEYVAAVELERVVPEPLLVRTASGRVEYHLLRHDPSRPMRIGFSLRASGMGVRHAVLAVGGRALGFRQLVLP